MTKGGQATHKQVMQAYRLLQKYKIHCDVLCVVHDRNVRQPAAVYRFFKEIGVQFLQFLPVVVRPGQAVGAESVPAEAYGEFLCAIFDEWVRRDIGRIHIQLFAEAERPFLGEEHALCLFRERCGDVVVVEHNGDFYACDHFVDPQHRIGNICETPLVDLLESPALRAFGHGKSDGLPLTCRECDVLSACNGGCPKDRFCRTADGEDGLNYLCAGFKRFFTHSRPYLQKLAALRQSGEGAEQLMQLLRAQEVDVAQRIGRNDLCFCGSGRKYKKCCLGKASFDA
jgi:uncharacterized protein